MKPCIHWTDSDGPHWVFYDEDISFEEYGELLVSLGLATRTDDDMIAEPKN